MATATAPGSKRTIASALNIVAVLFALVHGAIAAQERPFAREDAVRPVTVKDSIEFVRVLKDEQGKAIRLSPNGKRYLVVLARGDLARNGTWVELVCGGTGSLSGAAGATVARLFTQSRQGTASLIKDVRWLKDSERLTFLWNDGREPARIMELNVSTRQVRTLARYSTPIVQYDVTPDGRTLIFTAQAHRDLARPGAMRREGFAVEGQSAVSLLRGDVDGWTPHHYFETLVLSGPGKGLQKVRETSGPWPVGAELLRLAPDGRYAIAVRPAEPIPAEWDKYTEHIFRDCYLPGARKHPTEPNYIRQYFLIDVRKATIRPLWDAPSDPAGQVVWAPDGKSVLIGPTFLPVAEADAAGLAGRAVAEVDPSTGRFSLVPVPFSPASDGYEVRRRISDDVIELGPSVHREEPGEKIQFRKAGGDWQPFSAKAQSVVPAAPVRVELRQDLNTPPALYAVEAATGRERLIRDLNAQLRERALGRVEVVHWKSTDGSAWTGLLYYPVHYQPGRRFPLVVQTHGYSATDFSLDGAFTTAFAAQPLAARDIAVLQAGGPDHWNSYIVGTPREPEVFAAGFEGAAEHLVQTGLVDRAKVGVIGFSRTGWIVEYMLVHSSFPFAAAEAADNMDGGYLQYLLSDSGPRGMTEANTGASPFGEGLSVWARVVPTFNADKIRAPLRLEIDSGPITEILDQWEMFSNLRYLHKPVEFYVIPDIDHGTHVLQNPAQRLASQGGTVDWFCFWLKGEQDPDPSKAGEYARWQALAQQKADSPAVGDTQ